MVVLEHNPYAGSLSGICGSHIASSERASGFRGRKEGRMNGWMGAWTETRPRSRCFAWNDATWNRAVSGCRHMMNSDMHVAIAY